MKLKLLLASLVIGATLPLSLVPASAVELPADARLAAQQHLRLNNQSEVSSLDPHRMAAESDFNIGKDLFEGLVSQDKEGNIIPGIASHWEVSEDNRVYTFHLRNSQWSNGEPLTAEDFVYSFRRLLDPDTASPYSWFAQIPDIKNSGDIVARKMAPESLGVRALTPETLEITLTQPIPFLLRMLSHPVMAPVHQATIEAHGNIWTRPDNMVSNGPFRLQEWNLNEKLTLVKNNTYWNADQIVLEKITFLPIADSNVALKRYQAGELDALRFLPSEQLNKLRRDHGNELAKIAPSLHSTFYYINTEMPPTNDIRVRQALVYAVNREMLTRFVTGNGEIPMYGLTPPQVADFSPVQAEYEQWSQQQREEKARILLTEAGFGPDNPLTLSMVLPSIKQDQKLALALTGMWKKVLGAKFQIEKLEPKAFYATKDGYHLFRGGWVADYNEASTFLDIFNSRGSNPSGYQNPLFDQLIAQAKVTKDSGPLYGQAEEQLMQDLPLVPLYRPGHQLSLKKPYVGGYEFTNPEQNYYRRDAYILAH